MASRSPSPGTPARFSSLRERLADRRVLASIGVAILLLLVAAGFLLGGALGSPESTPSPSPLVTPSPSASPSPTPTPSPSPTPTPEPTPSPTPRPDALSDGRLTVLVLGSDSSASRRARGSSWLTDAITVVSVSGNGREIDLISLPRDTVDLRLADGSIWSGKANAITPLRGPGVMRDAMSNLLGIPIDYYLLVDMDDFARVVDAVGGVKVSVPYTLADKRCVFYPGEQRLAGGAALCYARHRYSDSDYARMGRHQELLLAIRRELRRNEVDIPAMAAALTSLQTDVPLTDLPFYADFLRAGGKVEVDRLLLTPPTYTTFVGLAGTRGWISVPNVPAIQAAVAAVLAD
jgi:LCP family protein required for cell wall assembly